MSIPGNTLTLETTKGPVVIEMRPELAPGHVAHIKRLVGEGFYDGVVFHRVIEGFMAQTGCPHGTGTGGSKLSRYSRPNSTTRRMCAAPCRWPARRARIRPIRNSSSASTTPSFLDRKYTVWGTRRLRHGERRQDQARRAGARPRQDRQSDAELSEFAQTGFAGKRGIKAWAAALSRHCGVRAGGAARARGIRGRATCPATASSSKP